MISGSGRSIRLLPIPFCHPTFVCSRNWSPALLLSRGVRIARSLILDLSLSIADRDGDTAEGIPWIEQGIRDFRAAGEVLHLPERLAQKAEALHLAESYF